MKYIFSSTYSTPLVMKNRLHKTFPLRSIYFLFLLAGLSLEGCLASHEPLKEEQFGFNSPVVLKNLSTAASSVVGVSLTATYRVETYRYEFLNGKTIPDSGSPTGYKLLPRGKGIIVSDQERITQGCGMLIYKDEKNSVVLTCQHVFSSPDTILSYYMNEDGKLSDILSSRSIKTHIQYYIVDQFDRSNYASMIHSNMRVDLALLKTETTINLGQKFPYDFSYDHKPNWGDPVYIFGYPKSSKQVTIGITSPLARDENFIVDGASRAGFSGGPVLGVRTDGNLEFLGIIRAVPAVKLRYISPPPELPKGAPLIEEDLPKTKIEEEFFPEGNAAFVVSTSKVGNFLKDAIPLLRQDHITLSPLLFPSSTDKNVDDEQQ